MSEPTTPSEVVSRVIRHRRTSKILATDGSTVEYSGETLEQNNSIVFSAIEDAGFAPFHYDRNLHSISEPWRFHFIDYMNCRYLAKKLGVWHPDMKPSNKLPAMLSACGCLVLIHWLPQFDFASHEEKQRQVDEEHLAATAAATQNFLLSLTAHGLKTYWSSGGFFRSDEMKLRLGIDLSEKLLSAIFVSYGGDSNTEEIGGKQHANRSSYRSWTSTVSIDEVD